MQCYFQPSSLLNFVRTAYHRVGKVRSNMRLCIFPRLSLFVQLTAIFLVQFYTLVPSLSRAITHDQPHHCRGNHVECGCSPERILSHTCCCFPHKSACCAGSMHSRNVKVKPGLAKASTPCLKTASCGSGSPLLIPTLEELKIVLPAAAMVNRQASFVLLALPLREKGAGRHVVPPDPPPKPFFSV